MSFFRYKTYNLIGDYMFNIGDYVTRNSYNNDIVFKIIDIKDDIYYLKGIYVRLYADSYEDDLVLCNEEEERDNFIPKIDKYRNLNRNEYFYLPGRVLHIDSDSKLSNTLTNPYKIREKAKIQKYKNHQKKHKMTKI